MDNFTGTYGGLRELALFAGAGGGLLASHALGFQTVCAVELDKYPQAVLAQRQNEGIFPPFPIWDDVRTFDGFAWRGIADIVSGGFPCQDVSSAGSGDGLDGARSGLWQEMARIIREVLPTFAFIENSPMLTSRGLDRVLCDLAQMGFDAEWAVISAGDCGLAHERERIWILGYSHDNGRIAAQKRASAIERIQGQTWANQTGKPSGSGIQRPQMADTFGAGLEGCDPQESQRSRWWNQWRKPQPIDWWKVESGLDRVANDVAYRVDRVKAIGNGQVPLVAVAAFKILLSRMINNSSKF